MDRAHEPPWLVGADRKDRKIERPKGFRYRAKLGVKRGVAGEKNRVVRGPKSPPAPESAVPPAQRSPGEVLGWNTGETQPSERAFLPPIPFRHFSCAALS
jgi:hypothetical protein